MLLATDLDGTFLEGEALLKKELYDLVQQSEDILLAYVTGRGIESVLNIFNDNNVPRPHYIICDVGATIVEGASLNPLTSIQQSIEKHWPGNEIVLSALSSISGLTVQPVPQVRRCSFFYDETTNIVMLKNRCHCLGCDVIISAGNFIDVLPAGVNKGSTLKKLAELLAIPSKKVLVAGDTMNDFALYQTGYNGVVVSNAEEELLSATADMANVYHASKAGCGGILQAMEHFNGF